MYRYITTAKLRVHFKWSPLYEEFLWNDYHPVNFSTHNVPKQRQVA